MGSGPIVGFQEKDLRQAAEQLKWPSPIKVSKDKLTILHLSDLHFDFAGGAFRFAKAPGNSDAPSLANKIFEALSSAGLLPDVIIPSGDFGFRQTHLELQNHAKREMDALQLALNVPYQRWIVVPGNHDIDWGSEKYDKTDKAPVYPGKTRDYFEYVYRRVEMAKECVFQKRLNGWSSDSDDDWKADPLRHYMPSYGAFELDSGQLIEIHGYNSCMVEGADWPGIGFIGDGQPRFFEYLSGPATSDSRIKIAVLHHHVKEVSTIISLPDDADVGKRMSFSLIADSRRLLDRLIRNGYGMLLHGHQHQPFMSQETLPCYGTDPSNDHWYRDYVDEKLLIFGAGSVSFWPSGSEQPYASAFFVHQIDADRTVTTWNFTMGAGLDKFQLREPCKQVLRGSFTPGFIGKRLRNSLTLIEKVDPAQGAVKLPEPCEAVDRVLSNGLQGLLEAIGALTHNGQTYDLNLQPAQPGDDRDRGRTTNLPARFANLLRMALQYKVPLFPDYWILPPYREAQPHIFNLIRWASLNLAQGILGSNAQKYFEYVGFERQVLSEYPAEMELPSDLCPPRWFVCCVVVRRKAGGAVELLLRHNGEWKAKLLPVIEISESKHQQWQAGKKDAKLALARPVFAGIIAAKAQCDIVEFAPEIAKIERKQISPSKGVWDHYLFNMCFMKFDASARSAIDQEDSLTFFSVDEIRNKWDAAIKEADNGELTWLQDPMKRAAIANRKLIEAVLKLLEKPDPNWFYELA